MTCTVNQSIRIISIIIIIHINILNPSPNIITSPKQTTQHNSLLNPPNPRNLPPPSSNRLLLRLPHRPGDPNHAKHARSIHRAGAFPGVARAGCVFGDMREMRDSRPDEAVGCARAADYGC